VDGRRIDPLSDETIQVHGTLFRPRQESDKVECLRKGQVTRFVTSVPRRANE